MNARAMTFPLYCDSETYPLPGRFAVKSGDVLGTMAAARGKVINRARKIAVRRLIRMGINSWTDRFARRFPHHSNLLLSDVGPGLSRRTGPHKYLDGFID